jgi:phosphoglycolate phosphatase-like HAD superfamily hydrolase
VADGVRVLILFDIDGTLLLTDGAGRAAFRYALAETFGTVGPLDDYTFHGKTDPQIAAELMVAAGLDPDVIERRLPEMWPLYLEKLERELEDRRRLGRVEPLPGVRSLLDSLDGTEGVGLGLVTGNLEPAARLKLAAADVVTPFEVGGFGSDSAVRAEIARIAVQRAAERFGGSFRGAEIVVVGDTPADVACARAVGARAITVATGRHAVGELTATGADVVFPDLEDTGAVLSAVLGPGRVAKRGAG